ncbi:bifunctional lysylphosphatidylglycerol flippase/synthetase MprF [Oceaniovalibus sp. ACAM 378]|uniref:bifunctional lysylphosphatidylglycerol flippase/synthetase MprF n=1 Tax=Oceaniovalibus sp. ACAM 378 TaxID=2599923 RepID=UPI0011DA55DC|nr:bifunctional lysylphosphatidylglycerol flippase/synthetase MprF [Oceaniovalibus sp. ACAM 378]TYB91123.1 bifunctional lysylphosphatidylglycerol flippase/synthetase MprF [Oceaniovalibus sp. ACAM 378]
MAVAEIVAPHGRLLRIVEHTVVKIAVPLIIVAIAFFVLHKLASHVKWTDVKVDLAAASPIALIKGLGFTVLSFLGISFYDALAVRSATPGKVPLPIAGLTGAAGYAVTGLLGVSYLTGTAVRFRVYSAFGLDLAAVAGVIAVSWSGFLTGLALIFGGLFVFHPDGLSAVLPIPPSAETGFGIAILLGFGAYLLWLATGRRDLKAGGFALSLPNFPIGAALAGAGVLDLTGAAMTLYVLMPGDAVQSLPYFFTIFFGAVGLGILSHSPGGLGVFEATIIAGLGASGQSDVLAALLTYRVIYTILPFVIAATGLGVIMGMSRRRQLSGGAQLVWRAFRPLIPPFAAGIALLAGLLLLISGNLPAEESRLGVLREILPLSFIEASHLAGSIAGVLLIVVARGLYRKLYRAWVVAMGLLAVGLVASLLKGLDWKESLSMLGTLAVLGLFRPAFYRADGASVLRLNGRWLNSILALLAAAFWVGLFAHSHVPYGNTLWWEFSWHGDASRFLRSSLAGAIVLGVIAFNSLMTGKTGRAQPQPIPDVVRALVAQSEDPEAGIALMGDKAFLVSDDACAFIAYADTGRSLIAKGDPVGDPKSGAKLIWQLRELADQKGRRCAFYAVSPAYLPTYLDLGLSILKIGEVARVDLNRFTLDGAPRKDLRQARNRAARDGCNFAVLPASELAAAMPELRAISDAWLESKQGEEKGFALGAFEESYIANFDVAVLRAGGNEIVAFANLFKGANLHELSLDLMRYRPHGPSFAMDALLAEIMLWGAAQGYRWFSLGAAPFSGIENRQLAPIWNRIGGFVYEHGEHFYNFEGLRAFKEKFGPEWRPNYLACPGGLAAPQILYEVNVLVSGGLRGLVR